MEHVSRIPESQLPKLLQADGILKLVSAAEYDAIPLNTLRYWCHIHARYGLPTIELIAWLKAYIGKRSVLEIGSGSGDLARHLGIKATDSWMQAEPNVARFYALTAQPTIKYPSWIERIGALDAIKKYNPEVVIASWVTNWIDPNLPVPEGGGSIYGIKEDEIVKSGRTYIFIGNLAVHQFKPIRAIKHKELILPFIKSRAKNPNLDRIMIWNDSD